MKRTRVEVIKIINAPISPIWESIADPTDIVNWSSVISKAELNGEASVGSTRTCIMGDDTFSEFIETLDHDLHIFQYSIPEPPFPIEGVLGTIKLKKVSDEQTKVSWSLNFSVDPEAEEEISEAIKGIYTDGIDGLERKHSIFV